MTIVILLAAIVHFTMNSRSCFYLNAFSPLLYSYPKTPLNYNVIYSAVRSLKHNIIVIAGAEATNSFLLRGTGECLTPQKGWLVFQSSEAQLAPSCFHFLFNKYLLKHGVKRTSKAISTRTGCLHLNHKSQTKTQSEGLATFTSVAIFLPWLQKARNF